MGCLLLISDGQRNSGSEMRCGSYTWRALAHQRSYGLEKLGLVKLEALLKGCPPTVELEPSSGGLGRRIASPRSKTPAPVNVP
jgi:hypothetical protein